MTKHCRRCNTEKELTDFYKDRSSRDGLAYECKACTKKRSKAWQKANPEKAKARQLAWLVANKDKHEETLRRYHSLGGWRAAWYRNRYGLSVEDVSNKIAEQNGECAICRTTVPGGRGQFAVDHDHATGDIRGMLCTRCNTALGSFNDSISVMESAINYLRKYKKPNVQG